MNRPDHQPTPPRLVITAWEHPLLDRLGHRPGSPYIEHVWLPILGPSTTWAYQHLARHATTHPGTAIDTAELAAGLGLSTATGPNSVLSRTLHRLVAFGAAQRHDDTLTVRRALPDIPARQLDRLPAPARLAHHHLAIAHRPPTPQTQAVPAPSQAVAL